MALEGDEDKRRSVCVEEMFYEPDGKIRPITRDPKGVAVSPVAPRRR